MLAPNRIRVCLIVICLQGWWNPSVLAQAEADEAVTNALPFVTKIIEEPVGGLPPISRAYLTVGTNEFAFLIPRGFRMETLADGKIVVSAKDYSSFISLERLEVENAPGPNVSRSARLEFYRGVLAPEHPGLRIRDQFLRAVDGRRGTAFDFEWRIDKGSLQAGRAVFVPTEMGVVEFKLITNPKAFRAATYKLNNLLLSFCSNKGGDLDVVHLSNKL